MIQQGVILKKKTMEFNGTFCTYKGITFTKDSSATKKSKKLLNVTFYYYF
jgi:hypothetical protein